MKKDKFIEQIEKYKKQMYVVAYSILKNQTDAEDVVQEALLTSYERLHTLQDEEKFKPWLMRILVNQAKMYIRKNSRIVYIGNEEEIDQVTPKNNYEEIWDVVLSLNSKLSLVVILYYSQGYSVKEISKIAGIPAGTVKSRLSKARELLRKELVENNG